MLQFGAKITQMKSPRNGKSIANQFIITEKGCGANGNFIKKETFQSYETIIGVKTEWNDRIDIELDEDAWNYSNTTSKYRNEFLGMNTKEVEKAIKSGEIKLTKLN